MTETADRLCNATLGRLRPQVVRPAYQRQALAVGIVHLGLGAFHRAHQAVYTEAAIVQGRPGWGIAGVSLRSAATATALNPQDGLYCLAVRDGTDERLRVIGALRRVLVAGAETRALIDLMAAPTTRIVSLTVTEKGYHLDPASRELRLEAPPVSADLARPAAPGTVYGLIAQALDRRRAEALPPFTVLCCDNLPANGSVLRRALLRFAAARSAALRDWIAGEVAFPSTMVDRITPATTDADRQQISESLGLADAWPVVTEPFSQWVIEDRFPLGRPDWEAGGATFSPDIAAWETMKLRMLNGAHSAIAYLGQIHGHQSVDAAMADPRIAAVVAGLWQETAETFATPADPAAYARALKARFLNPALGHRTAQIAMDGSQKLPQRLVDPLRDRLQRGAPCQHLATAVAAWMVHVLRQVRSGGAEALDDPLAGQIAHRIEGTSGRAEDLVAALLSLEGMFGRDLANAEALRRSLVPKAVELLQAGQAASSPGDR